MERKYLILGAIALAVIFIISAAFFMWALSNVPSDCVAVIRIDGEIATSSSSGGLFGSGTTGSDELAELVKEAEDRSDVKAIVFEVNSPGGSVVASREMYEAIKKAKKPKVAYMREVAASGGYYVSMGVDYIVANPDVITGSIGVISTNQELSGLFEKLGINQTSITTGPHKDMGSPARPMTDEEKAILQGIINEMYAEFKGLVVESRGSKLDMSQFDKMTDGRIVTGRQAYKAGLVDALGNKQDAIDKAGEMAGMEKEPDVCTIETEKGLLYDLFKGMGQGVGKALASAGKVGNSWTFGYR